MLVCFAVPVLTQIPKSKTNEEAVTGLLALAHDCHAAYGAGAEKASDAELKQALQKFAKQADSHIEQWRSGSALYFSHPLQLRPDRALASVQVP